MEGMVVAFKYFFYSNEVEFSYLSLMNVLSPLSYTIMTLTPPSRIKGSVSESSETPRMTFPTSKNLNTGMRLVISLSDTDSVELTPA